MTFVFNNDVVGIVIVKDLSHSNEYPEGTDNPEAPRYTYSCGSDLVAKKERIDKNKSDLDSDDDIIEIVIGKVSKYCNDYSTYSDSPNEYDRNLDVEKNNNNKVNADTNSTDEQMDSDSEGTY